MKVSRRSIYDGSDLKVVLGLAARDADKYDSRADRVNGRIRTRMRRLIIGLESFDANIRLEMREGIDDESE